MAEPGSGLVLFTVFNEIGIIEQLARNRFERALATVADGLRISHFSLLNHFVRLGDDISPAGAVPAVSGPQLTLTRSTTPSDLDLSWGASCSVTDLDYAVYEGTLGDFTSHTPVVAPSCTTGGATSATITPGAGDRYYLIVPLSDTGFEGGYGSHSDGTPRQPSLLACEAQSTGLCL